MRRIARITAGILGAAVVLLVPLAIPPAEPVAPVATGTARPFEWRADSVWADLESRFVAARSSGCADSTESARAIGRLDAAILALGATQHAPSDSAFDRVERYYFDIAPSVAACGALLDAYVRSYARLRATVKEQSRGWDVNSVPARDRLYRALYGGRAAVEEVMLQQPERASPLLRGVDESSATPSAVSNGVTLHSGDMLVSRGGYPTSALIARGNDYPGNFSHVALVHVDSVTRAISVVEAHIERGVVIATAEEYLADKKLRVMLVRPRADLPALVADPMLPHRAASAMLARARSEHIAYDFAMDYAEPERLFCSEVASQAYRPLGVELWMGLSTISRPGLRRWLASFGVVNFETQEPSDLEYDPQLVVVAEWHDAATLFDDHIANAVTDVMLEGAERGDRLTYPWYELPLARVLKGWSWVREQGGGVGPIPEGMAPASALRNRGYGVRHAELAARVREAAAAWRAEHGYAPPYWTLVELARQVGGIITATNVTSSRTPVTSTKTTLLPPLPLRSPAVASPSSARRSHFRSAIRNEQSPDRPIRLADT